MSVALATMVVACSTTLAQTPPGKAAADNPLPVAEAKPAKTGSLRREALDAYAGIKGVVKRETDIDSIAKKYLVPGLSLESAKRLLESSGFTVVQASIPPAEKSNFKLRLVGCLCNIDTRPYLNADIIIVIESLAGKVDTVKGRIIVADL
jgi:hypothetical protein